MKQRKLRLAVLAAVVLTAAVGLVSTAFAETSDGTFIVRCDPVFTKSVDPIVSPGVEPSAHLHQFFGNPSMNKDATYQSMTAIGNTATCKDKADTSATWIPALLNPQGQPVTPTFSYDYYKTIPTHYSTTQPFPPDFRMIAGGADFAQRGGKWDCREGSAVGSSPIPYCPNGHLQVRLKFPNCWDGVNLDSPNHRSHVVYPSSSGCPADHPIKLPLINFFVIWPNGSGGPGWHLADQGMTRSDGTVADGVQLHADYWNTWQQPALNALVQRCLNAGINCGQVTG